MSETEEKQLPVEPKLMEPPSLESNGFHWEPIREDEYYRLPDYALHAIKDAYDGKIEATTHVQLCELLKSYFTTAAITPSADATTIPTTSTTTTENESSEKSTNVN